MSSDRHAIAPFVLVTGNPNKALEAERVLGLRPKWHAVDLPEIQSLDLIDVLRAKADVAWDALQQPLVVDETSLELGAMNGFPGPLVKWMLESVGAAGIARTADALEDRRIVARCALLYRDGQGEILAEGRVGGTSALEERGDGGFGWDKIFIPDGHTRTFAEMSAEEKDRIGHRGLAWRALIERLKTGRPAV